MEPALAPVLSVKWPNDVMLGSKKCAGIITESGGGDVLAGIGVNVAETFAGTALNAASIACELAALDAGRAAAYTEAPHRIPLLLEKILFSMHDALLPAFDGAWRKELEKALYMRGKNVRFRAGAPDRAGAPAGGAPVVNGRIAGIRDDGALLIIPEGKTEAEAFAAGELEFFAPV
jgi:BirA family biotin operon repressor/biotin-[acetyl-CoA-carboxylase] ligase